MDILFTPSAEVADILNALLDKLESRAQRDAEWAAGRVNLYTAQNTKRAITLPISEASLPPYFSQTDPEPRLIANRQLQELEKRGLLKLIWLPGETGHLLHAVTLLPQHAASAPSQGAYGERHAALFALLHRSPLAVHRAHLATLLLADRCRFPDGDWRARAVATTLDQLRAGKSPAPFSLTDSEWNLDLLTALAALSGLETEIPYRLFSVRTFNDSKRFEALKPALVQLARRANPKWKALPTEALLEEWNLVANPNYIHLAGSWQVITNHGEILSLDSFTPSMGFPAAQTAALQAVNVHAEAVLGIENLTTFHEFIRAQASEQQNKPPGSRAADRKVRHAVLCTMGNPSPAIRRMLRLIPDEIPIYLWADLDYGGFNILGQLRQQVRADIQPHQMDVAALETYAHLSRPLTHNDERHLKRLLSHRELKDVHPVIEYLLKRRLKLEQEAFDVYPGTNRKCAEA